MIDSSRKNSIVNKKNIQAHSLHYFWTLYLSIYFADNSFFEAFDADFVGLYPRPSSSLKLIWADPTPLEDVINAKSALGLDDKTEVEFKLNKC